MNATQDDPMTVFDALATAETERALRAIPAECASRAADMLALRLAGVRAFLAMWQPRPTLEAAEMPAWRAEVQSIVSHLADDVVGMLLRERDSAAVYARQRLQRWNAEREVNRPARPWQIRQQIEGSPKSTLAPDEQRTEQLPDGTYVTHYRPPQESAEDIAAENRAQRDRERRANQTDTTTP